MQVIYFAPRATRTAMNGAAVRALNTELGVAMDSPESVAATLIALLEKPVAERPLGMPERLFSLVNRVAPRLVDLALRHQLPIIRRHARGNPVQPDFQGEKP